MIKKVITTALLIFALSGCISVETVRAPQDEKTLEEPQIVSQLPKEMTDYTYEGYHIFPAGYGYSLRYRNLFQERHYADIYIWPVHPEHTNTPHNDLVTAFSKGAVSDIFTAQEQGKYSDVKVLSEETFIVNGKNVSEHTLSYKDSGVPVFSYVFVSESNGELLKARLTLKDTARNQQLTEPKEFVSDVFQHIIEYQKNNKN